MTERFIDWLNYSQSVDQIFANVGITTVVIVLAGYLLWRSSMAMIRVFIKIILGLVIFGLGLAWYLDFWPWG